MVRIAGLEPARPFGQGIFLLLHITMAANCVVVWTIFSSVLEGGYIVSTHLLLLEI